MQPNFDAIYRALVTDNFDPSGAHKIKVQCPQIAGIAEIRQAEPINYQMPVPLVGTTVWLGFSGGDITKPYYFTNKDYMYLNTNGTTVQANSLTSGTTNDSTFLSLVSGVDGSVSGTVNTPHVSIKDGNNTTPVDMQISGAIVKTDANGTPQTWHLPSYSSTWTDSTIFFGSPGTNSVLRYRLDAEDNLWLFGCFRTVGTLPTDGTVLVLPSGFHPQGPGGVGGMMYVPCMQGPVSGTPSTSFVSGMLAVQSNGSVIVSVTGGLSVAINTSYYVNGKVPMGALS